MKKVLVLAYDFPPYTSAGALRPYSWLNYFREFDLDPVIVTRHWNTSYGNEKDYVSSSESRDTTIEVNEKGTLIRVPYAATRSNRLFLKHGEKKYRSYRKVLTGLNELSHFYFPIGAKRPIYEAARSYLQQHDVACIIATGDPYILFHYANELSEEFSIPWIADYRDPWSEDIGLQDKHFLKKIYRKLEGRIVANARAITVLDEYVETLQKQFPSKEILPLINGFDPHVIEEVNDQEQARKHLTLSYMGTIYPWHPIEGVLRVLVKLNKTENTEVHLNLYGVNNVWHFQTMVRQQFGSIHDKVHFIPKMANADVLRELKKDNIMLLFNYYNFSSTKIFEYLAIKRKILLCFTNDEESNKLRDFYLNIESPKRPQIEILYNTNAGHIIENENHLFNELVAIHNEFLNYKSIVCESKNTEIYSRKIQVSRLCNFIHTFIIS